MGSAAAYGPDEFMERQQYLADLQDGKPLTDPDEDDLDDEPEEEDEEDDREEPGQYDTTEERDRERAADDADRPYPDRDPEQEDEA